MQITRHPSINEQKRFWEWHWKHWKERKTINEWKDNRNVMVLSFLNSLSLSHLKILDLGCGPGRYSASLTRFGEVTGVDLSEEAINAAKIKYPHITFIAGDLYKVDLPSQHFDVVIAQEVIDHVEDQVAFVDRAAYTLKSEGFIILSCANKFVMDRVGDDVFPEQPAAHIADFLDMRRLNHLLRSHFRVLRIKTIIPMGHQGILRLLNSHKLNTALGFFIPQKQLTAMKEWAGFGYQIIALAQKTK